MAPLAASADDWTMGGQNLSNWRNQGDTPISSQNVAKLKTRWVFTTAGDVTATPAVANGIVYFPDFKGNFYAVNANSGALVWTHKLEDWTGISGDFARNDPAIYGGMVMLGNQAGNNAFWNGSQYAGPCPLFGVKGLHMLTLSSSGSDPLRTSRVQRPWPTCLQRPGMPAD